MAALPMIATVASTVVSAAGTIAAGNASRQAGEWQDREYGRQAMAERAAAQRESEQVERRTALTQSRLQTVGAASGLSTTDPTALNLAEEIGSFGDLQARTTRYGGEDRATGLSAQGAMARYSGRAAQSASRFRAVGTILGGIGGLARYGDTRAPSSGNDNYLGWG